MVLLSLLMVGFMLIFPNVLFYTVSLLVVSIVVLTHLTSCNCMSTLMIILIIIVYVGAIIIFIGYICAVCPNLIISPSFKYVVPVLAVLFFETFGLFGSNFVSFDSSKTGMLLDFFLSEWGVSIFILIVLMLFFVLLIVTSQYMSPQGPFRSN